MLIKNFDFLIESYKNKSNIEILQNSILNDTISHAYLFSGNNIDYLTEIAFNFSASVNCTKKGCGKCRICRNTLKGIFENMIIIESDGPSITIDKVLELHHFMNRSAYSAGKKICIIKEAELLNDTAANSLLKILEEPPDRNSVFILLAESISKVIPTISSRCMVFEWDFKDSAGIKINIDILRLNKIISEGIKDIILPQNKFDKAIDLSIQITDFFKSEFSDDNDLIKDKVIKLKEIGATTGEVKKYEESLKLMSKKKKNKYYYLGMNLVFDIITAWLTDLASVKSGAMADVINYPENYNFIKENAGNLDFEDLLGLIDIVEKNRSYLNYSIYDEIALDNIFLRLKKLVTKEVFV